MKELTQPSQRIPRTTQARFFIHHQPHDLLQQLNGIVLYCTTSHTACPGGPTAIFPAESNMRTRRLLIEALSNECTALSGRRRREESEQPSSFFICHNLLMGAQQSPPICRRHHARISYLHIASNFSTCAFAQPRSIHGAFNYIPGFTARSFAMSWRCKALCL